MKNALSKIFGGVKMTWLKVILFAVVVAFITAVLMIFPIFENCPLRDMGVGFECWFVFAIFIISNCHSPLEAGLKTFVFFLISQPLIYLFQQPFSEIDLLRTYYFKWFILTLFTFPGGMLAFLVKKDKLYSPFILAVAGIFLGFSGAGGVVNSCFSGNIADLLYCLLFVIFTIVAGFALLKAKRNRIIYLVLVCAAILVAGTHTFLNAFNSGTIQYDIQQEGSWQINGYECSGVTAKMEDEDTVVFIYEGNSHGTFHCSSQDNKQIKIIITVEKGIPTITEEETN